MMFIKYYNDMFKGEKFENAVPNTKQLLIYGYLFMNRTMRDEVVLSLEDMIESCGYRFNRHIGKSLNTFRQELHNMVQQKHIGHFELSTEADILSILPSKVFQIKLGNIMTDYDNFTQLPFDDFDKIVSSSYKYVGNLLLVYLYIKSFIYQNSNEQANSDFTQKINPKACYMSYREINEATGISISSIQVIIKELQRLKLLTQYITGGYITHNAKICNAENIYVLYGDEDQIPLMEEKIKEFYRVKEFHKFKQGE